MDKELKSTGAVTIKAPAQLVWEALTAPEWTKQYMFGCEAVSDWTVGSPLLWKGVWEGKEMVAVKGSIVAITKHKLLKYTTIDPNNAAIPDVPENYLTVTYELEEKDGQTHVKVSQGDYAKVKDGKARYEETLAGGGWNALLEQIKILIERSL